MTRSYPARGWRFALAAVALLAAGPAAAQTPGVRACGTPSPSQQEVFSSVVQAEQWIAAHPDIIAQQRGGIVTIPMAVHIVSSGDSPNQGEVPQAWIDAQTQVLNDAFLSMGFQFVVAFQQRVRNADWANLAYGGADEVAMKQTLHLDVARYLNAYYTPNITSPQGALLGFATFPNAQAETDFMQGVVNISGSLPGGNAAPYNLGDTATHEIGHWAGLFHTFQGGCGGSGDGVADTPAEASPAFGCPVGRDTCPADPGPDPITNFMDYVDDICMTEFTTGQATRALALMNQFRPTIMTQAGAFFSAQALVFSDLFIGQTETREISIVNIGSEAITFTSIGADNAAFSVSPASATVPAGGTLVIEVTFAPITFGAVTGTLTAVSSDPEIGTLTASLSGNAAEAAQATFSALAFSAEAAVGGSATRTLTIANAGPAALDYSFSGGTRFPALAQAPGAPFAEKGAGTTTGAAAQRFGSGGPDAFGYSWIDSNEPGGPAYAWVDISSTGTAVPLGDDAFATVALPFPFPFYGVDRTSVNIVSNGFLNFGTTSTAFTNTGIPNSGPPNSLIAPFWYDLDPGDGNGMVYYRNMGDGRFIVQYDGVPDYPGPGAGTENTFEVVLYADGTVLFQYEELNGNVVGSTVGIENADGTDGLQVAFEQAYLEDGLAVRFATRPDWLSVDPAAGTVDVDGSEDVTLTFDATELEAGAYQELLALSTNDPAYPQPTRIHVVFAVGGALAPPALAAPLYGLEDTPTDGALDWLPAAGAATYEWELSTSATFATIEDSGSGPATSAVVTLDVEETYFWRVRSVSGGTSSDWSLPFTFSTAGIVASEGGADRDALALGAAFPNPTRGALTIPFTLAAADGAVTLRVIDVTGREVTVLAQSASYGAGTHRVEWNAAGFPAGVYLVQLQAGGQVQTTRVTVLR